MLSMRELKRALDERGVDYSGAIERSDLIELYQDSSQSASSQPASPQTSSPSPVRSQSSLQSADPELLSLAALRSLLSDCGMTVDGVCERHELEAMLRSEQTKFVRFTGHAAIREALVRADVRLLKATWLVALARGGGRLRRRQELPEEAFVTVAEFDQLVMSAERKWDGEPQRDGVLPVIAVSYCWLSQADPDPQGEHLANVASEIEATFREWERYGFSEMCVFWEYHCSATNAGLSLHPERSLSLRL
jgi:hypothetical protein